MLKLLLGLFVLLCWASDAHAVNWCVWRDSYNSCVVAPENNPPWGNRGRVTPNCPPTQAAALRELAFLQRVGTCPRRGLRGRKSIPKKPDACIAISN